MEIHEILQEVQLPFLSFPLYYYHQSSLFLHLSILLNRKYHSQFHALIGIDGNYDDLKVPLFKEN